MPIDSTAYGNPTVRRVVETGTGELSPVSNLESYQEDYNPSDFGSPVVGLGEYGRSKYDKQLSRQNIQYVDKLRHERQSGFAQFGNFLNQAIVGEIVGGSLEGLGYLADVKQYSDLAKGTEQEFGNMLSNVGKNLRSWTEDVTPIYTDPDKAGQFSPEDWSWWMSNGKSVASTLSLLIPAVGTVRAASYAGRAIGLTKNILKASKSLGLAPEYLSWAANGVSQAVVSRHMENMMEASQTYEETLRDRLTEGVSYDKSLELASAAASNSYKLNWAMLAQDIPEYLILGNFMSKASSAASLKLAKEFKLPVTSLIAKKSTGALFDVGTEGAEEGYQYIVGEESRHLAKALSDPEYAKSTDFVSRLGEYAKSGDFWTNITMGALGAGVTLGVADIIGKVNRGEKLTKEEQRIKQIYDLGAEFKYWNDRLVEARELNNEAAEERSMVGLVAAIGKKASAVGNIETNINFLKNIKDSKVDQDDLQRYGMTEDNVNLIKEKFPNIEQDLRDFETIFNKYTNPKSTKTYSPEDASILAQNEFTLNKLKGRRTSIENKLADSKQELFKQFKTDLNNKISVTGEDLITTDGVIESLASNISFLKSYINKSKDRGEELLKPMRDRLSYMEDTYKVTRKHQRELLKNYTKEDQAKDAKLGFIRNDIKDTSLYKDYVKSNLDLNQLDNEINGVSEALKNNIKRIELRTPVNEIDKLKKVKNIHDKYSTDYRKILEATIKDADEVLKGKVNNLLDKGVSPITLLSGSKFRTAINRDILEVESALRNKLASSKHNILDTLDKGYRDELFTAQHSILKQDLSDEDYGTLFNQTLSELQKELNKNITPDVTTEEIFEGEPVTVTKTNAPKDVDTVVNNINNASTTEDVISNDLYTDPVLLSTKLSDLLTDINSIKVNYKGNIGIITDNKGNTVFSVNEDLTDGYIFTKSELDSTLEKLNIKPYKHTLFDINIENNKIKIGNRSFNIPLNNPLSAITFDNNDNPISVTLNNKTFKQPILVQELSYTILLLNEVRAKAASIFKLDDGAGIIVTDTKALKAKNYLVYFKDNGWVVVDPDNKKVSKRVNETILTNLFSVLDEAIDKGNLTETEQNEFRQTITIVRRADAKEVNSQPSDTTIPSPEGIKEETTETGDSGEEEGRSIESELTKDVADKLADNVSVNNVTTETTTITVNPNETVGNINPTEDIIDSTPSSTYEGGASKRHTLLVNHTNNKEMYLYFTNPNNNLVGDRMEFVIDYDAPVDFFTKHPDIKERIANGDLTILEDNDIVDNIPIITNYITKDGDNIKGYYVPIQSNTIHVEVPYLNDDTKDLESKERYYNNESAKRHDLRVKSIKALLAGNRLVAYNFEKNEGVPISSPQGTKFNISRQLGVPAKALSFGVADRNGIVRDSDGNRLFVKNGSAGNIFVTTNLTCDKTEKCIKCNPTKISAEHADFIYEAFKVAVNATKLYNAGLSDLFKSGKVYAVVNGEKKALTPNILLNLLVYHGEENTKVDPAKRSPSKLYSKQLFTKNNKLYYGDFEFKEGTGGIIDLVNPKKEDKDKFINYITSNFNYTFPIDDINKPFKHEYVIGSIKAKEGELYKEFIVNNNLLTIDTAKHTKYGTLYHNPYVRINVDNLVESDNKNIPVSSKETNTKVTDGEIIKDELIPIVKEGNGLDFFKSVEVGDIILQKTNDGERRIGVIVNHNNIPHLQITDREVLSGEYSGLKEYISLSDTNSLTEVLDNYISALDGLGLDPVFTVQNQSNFVTEEAEISGIELGEDVGDIDYDAAKSEDFDGLARLADNKPSYEKIDVNKAKDWLRKNLGDIRVDFVDKYIKVLSNGKQAHGMFTVDAITLYKAAETGTEYHEAFHRVSMLYLTKQERARVYNEARRKYNIPKATNRDIEEKLAEEFRNYVLTAEENVQQGNNILKFFKDLLDFIVTFFTGKYRPSDLTIDKLYKSIASGKYRFARSRRSNVIQFTGEQYLSEVGGFTSDEVDNIVDYMMFQLVNTNNITSPEDVTNISVEPVKDLFKRRLSRYVTIASNLSKLKTRNDKQNKDLQNCLHDIDTFKRILENFKSFKEALDDKLYSLNIRARVEVSDDGLEYETEVNDDTLEDYKIQNYDKTTYEFDSADNILNNIKLFIATMPNTNSSRGNKTQLHPTTGFPVFEDFKTAWNKLMFTMWPYTDVYDMIKAAEEKAETDIFYKTLLYGITINNELVRPGLLNGSETLRTQFFRALSKYKYDFVSLVEYYGRFYAASNLEKSEAGYIIDDWGKSFLNSQVFVTNTSNINKDYARSVINDFNNKLEELNNEYSKNNKVFIDLNKHIDTIKTILGKLNISVDTEDINNYIQSESVSKNITLDNVVYNIFNNRGFLIDIFGKDGLLNDLSVKGKLTKIEKGKEVTVPLDYYIKDKKLIKELAYVHSSLNIDMVQNTVLGPDNNRYYIYAQSNFLTDFVKNINKPDGVLINELYSDIYNQNSYFLNQVKNGSKLKLHTLSSFNNKAYRSMNEEDDFRCRFHFMMKQNYIPLPTMADKPVYGFFSGVERVNFKSAFLDKNGNYEFPTEVYNIIRGYITDETNRITKAKNDIQHAKDINNYDNLVKNYHFKVNDDGSLDFNKANAIKYIHFPELNGTDGNITDEQIKRILLERIKETLEYANNLSIIKIPRYASGKISNITSRKLDVNLVNDSIKQMNNNTQMGIYNLMADYTVNTIIGSMEAEKLLSKDIAYYKDNEDKIKRLSALIAPGESIRSKFKTGEFANKTTYTTITLHTPNYVTPFYKEWKKDFVIAIKDRASLFNEEVDDIQAELQADILLKSYTAVNGPDGEVFITPQFHREIAIRLGEWYNSHQEAYDILMSDKELSVEEELKLSNLVMQPLKLVYYGVTNKDNLGIPVYDKMSLATLFPRTVKNNAKIRPLLERAMNAEDPIQMIKFDSAVKAGSNPPIKYFISTENSDYTIDTSVLNKLSIQTQSFDNLRLQQVTDPHNINRVLLATQVRKIIADNIPGISKILSSLSNKAVERLKNTIGINRDGIVDLNKLIRALRQQAVQSALSSDTVDNFKIDPKNDERMYLNVDCFHDRKWIESRLISLIEKETIKTNVPGNSLIQVTSYGDDNMVGSDKLKLRDDNGSTEIIVSISLYKDNIPHHIWKKGFTAARAWLLENKEKLEGIAYRIPTQSPNMVVPYVVKDVLPEYEANSIIVPLEFTSLTDSDFDVDKLFIFKYNYKVIDNKLHYVEFIQESDTDDKVYKQQTLIKLHEQNYRDKENLLRLLYKIKGSDYSDVQKQIYESDNPRLYERLIKDYVLPTLENWSIRTIKPEDVDFVISELENEIPTIDEYIKSNQGNKSVYDLNSSEALENKMLEAYIEYLTDDTNILETRSPLAKYVGQLKEVANEIRKLEGSSDKKESLYTLTPKYQHSIRNIYLTSKSGVGPYALATVHHCMGMNAGLALPYYIGVGHRTTKGGTDISQKYEVEPWGGELIKETIVNRLASFISANVDAPKDPYIFYANISKETWGVSALLVRAGYGLNSLYFLAQPILKEVAAGYMDRYDVYLKYEKKLNKAIRAEKLNKKAKAYINLFSSDEEIFNTTKLKHNINKNTERNAEWYARQLAVYDKYSSLRKEAFKVGATIQYSQIDTGGFSKSILGLKYFNDKLEGLLAKKDVINFDKLINDTFLKAYRKNGIELILKAFSNLTIGATPAFLDMYKTITNSVINQPGLTKAKREALEKRISNELFSSVISRYFIDKRGYGYDADKIKTLFFGDKSIVSIVNSIKQQSTGSTLLNSLHNNYLIKQLRSVHPDSKDLSFGYFELPVRDKNKYYKDRIKNALEELLNHDNESVRKIGRSLVAYTFYISGFNHSLYSFHEAIPLKYFKELPEDLTKLGANYTYNDYIHEQLKLFTDNVLLFEEQNDMVKDVYLNNWFNDDFVPVVKTNNDVDTNNPLFTKPDDDHKINTPYIFTYSGENKTLFVGYNINGEPLYKPYVKWFNTQNYKNYLYEYVGYIEYGEDTKPIYKLIDKKGYSDSSKHVVKEYGLGIGTPSIFKDNNLLFGTMPEEYIKGMVDETTGELIGLNKHLGYEYFNYISPEYRLINLNKDEYDMADDSETKVVVPGEINLIDNISNITDEEANNRKKECE